jgi:hypothetical protein
MGKFVKATSKWLGPFLPKPLKWTLLDWSQDFKRHFPSRHRGNDRFGLKPNHIYPHGINLDGALADALEIQNTQLKVTREAKVASIGSCFAEEFSYYMRRNGYNYIVIGTRKDTSSCDWGRVYTIANLKNIVRYSLESDFPLYLEHSHEGWFDPLREFSDSPFYRDRDEAERAIREHRQNSRRVFEEAQVLAITLGQNENWIDAAHKIAWGRRPPQDLIDGEPSRFRAAESSYGEDLSDLRETVDALLRFNKQLSLIITVSPVPAHATFTSENVITQSFAHKCILRAVVHELQQIFPERVLYFPSFEITLGYNPFSFKSDNRHVQFRTLNRIFRIFERVCT